MSSIAEQTLAAQLEQAGIPFEREYEFVPEDEARRRGWVSPVRGLPRRWRFDFAWPARDEDIGGGWRQFTPGIAVEIEGGSYTGGHKRGKAYESDCDKHNAAMDLGWKVYRFTPAHVNDGRALAVIRRALGLAVAA
jgi:hypothetical protein